jgi:hypothetical protein
MPGLQDLIAAARASQGARPQGIPAQPMAQPPMQAQGQPQTPQGQPGQAPNLQAIAQRMQQPAPPPAPTKAQTVAALHRFGEIKQTIGEVAQDPNLGTKNIRPKLLDAASELLASKVLSLPEIMNAIQGLPDDPQKQKAFVINILRTADQAQKTVLAHHSMAPPEPDDAEQWSPDNHNDQMAALMQKYGK